MNDRMDSSRLIEHPLWKKISLGKGLISFDLEITARCNNRCRHCCINLPATDQAARKKELSLEEIGEIADEAVSSGVLWCSLTGGEPLLREDFLDIYLSLKKRGLLVSILTNATLVTKEHIKVFQKYPPRDMEVSVYGVTRRTYERVTRREGSFGAFRQGLNLLLRHYGNIRLKAMALRSNAQEFSRIMRFCHRRSYQFSRFDPLLYLRFDGNPRRNREIIRERLSPEEIVALERSDLKRTAALVHSRDHLINPGWRRNSGKYPFTCGIGLGHLNIGYDGLLRPCFSMWHPEFLYDLRKGSLTRGHQALVQKIEEMRFTNKEFMKTCPQCSLMSLCDWCPAKIYLEYGRLEARSEYFCQVAHARAALIINKSREMSIPSTRSSNKEMISHPPSDSRDRRKDAV